MRARGVLLRVAGLAWEIDNYTDLIGRGAISEHLVHGAFAGRRRATVRTAAANATKFDTVVVRCTIFDHRLPSREADMPAATGVGNPCRALDQTGDEPVKMVWPPVSERSRNSMGYRRLIPAHVDNFDLSA